MMLSRVKRFVKKLRALHALSKDGYLVETGWFDSFIAGRPIDRDGNAIPWIAYTAIDFIQERVKYDMTVFEFGSGASTLWWAKRVKHIDAVENDREWFSFVQSCRAHNSTIYLETDEGYFTRISTMNKRYDIVIIDGLDRNRCLEPALASLTSDGIIVWDDSHRQEYSASYEKLAGHGFKRLSFTGISPIYNNKVETTIFYRPNNCFNI